MNDRNKLVSGTLIGNGTKEVLFKKTNKKRQEGPIQKKADSSPDQIERQKEKCAVWQRNEETELAGFKITEMAS